MGFYYFTNDKAAFVNRGSGVSDPVKMFVSRHKVIRLSYNAASSLLQCLLDLFRPKANPKPWNGLELIQRPAGMSQPASGNHWHAESAGGQCGSQNQGGLEWTVDNLNAHMCPHNQKQEVLGNK